MMSLLFPASNQAIRLSNLRGRAGLTWKEIAQLLTVTPSMVYQVLSGKRQLSEKSLYRLEAAEVDFGIITVGKGTALAACLDGTDHIDFFCVAKDCCAAQRITRVKTLPAFAADHPNATQKITFIDFLCPRCHRSSHRKFYWNP